MMLFRPPIRILRFPLLCKWMIALCVTCSLSGCYTQLEKPGSRDPVDETAETHSEEEAAPRSGVSRGEGDPHAGVAWRSEYDHDWETLALMRDEVKALLGDGTCVDDGNCRAVRLAWNPNDSRMRWLIYSDFMLREQEFKRRVREHIEFGAYLMKKWDVAPIGAFPVIAPPIVRCEFGRCVTGGRGF